MGIFEMFRGAPAEPSPEDVERQSIIQEKLEKIGKDREAVEAEMASNPPVVESKVDATETVGNDLNRDETLLPGEDGEELRTLRQRQVSVGEPLTDDDSARLRELASMQDVARNLRDGIPDPSLESLSDDEVEELKHLNIKQSDGKDANGPWTAEDAKRQSELRARKK